MSKSGENETETESEVSELKRVSSDSLASDRNTVTVLSKTDTFLVFVCFIIFFCTESLKK